MLLRSTPDCFALPRRSCSNARIKLNFAGHWGVAFLLLGRGARQHTLAHVPWRVRPDRFGETIDVLPRSGSDASGASWFLRPTPEIR